MSCPICTAPVENESCETCGSLEGVDASGFAASRVFGYDWAAGSVAPWRDASGNAYATPAELAEVALAAAGLEEGGYVIDLGCGDAAILRAAAMRYGCRGLGLDIDDGALADAARAIEADGVAELVSVRRGDLRDFQLDLEVEAHAGAPVVVTCYLLPATLRELRPKLEDACRRGAAVVLFRWDCGPAWRGPPGFHDSRGFTVYRPVEEEDSDGTESDSEMPDRLSPLVDVLSFEALHYLDAEGLARLDRCARKFGFVGWRRDEAYPCPQRRSFCEDVACRRLRADERFRDHRTGEFPSAYNIDRSDRSLEWGRFRFLGWMHLLRDWERALAYDDNMYMWPRVAVRNHLPSYWSWQRISRMFVDTPIVAYRRRDREAKARLEKKLEAEVAAEHARSHLERLGLF
jgi:hypothetical protein